jgi:hypothetical protein
MISVITNIYNEKTKGPTLIKLFTATGKLKKFFFDKLQMFAVCTMGAFRQGSLQQWRISMHSCWRVCGKNLDILSMCAVSPVVQTSNISSCQKTFYNFPVAVNNSIMAGPLVFML